jgi:HEAT repeat protein
MRFALAISLLLCGGCSSSNEATPLDELALQAKHFDPNMRYSAMEQIGNLRPPDASSVATLVEGLRDRDPTVRLGAAYALGNVGTVASSAAPALASALKDRDKQVRLAAAYALPALGQGAEAALPDLELRLRDPDAEVRNQAARSIKAIRTSSRVRHTAQHASTSNTTADTAPARKPENRRLKHRKF